MRRHDIVRETIYKISAIRKIDPYRLIANDGTNMYIGIMVQYSSSKNRNWKRLAAVRDKEIGYLEFFL